MACQRVGKRLDQCLLADRLRDEVVHAGVAAIFDIVRKGIGGQRNDRKTAPVSAKRADRARCFKPVHFGHAHVHERDIESTCRSLLDRQAAVRRNRNIDIEALQQLGEHHLVGGIVFSQQDLQRPPHGGQYAHQFIFCGADAAGHGERRLIGNRQREPDGEHRADAEDRLDPDFAAHLLDDPLADREAQPRAAILSH